MQSNEIEELDLNNRTYNCIKLGGINTLAELISLTEKELKTFRNMSYKNIVGIKRCLKEMEMELKKEK